MLGGLGCSDPQAFPCSEDAQCNDGRVQGRCEAAGWCSFADPDCPSGQKFGAHAGNGLAQSCVPQSSAMGSTGPSGGSTQGAQTGGMAEGEAGSEAMSDEGPEPVTSGSGPGPTTSGGDTGGTTPCEEGFADCDGAPGNGCEANLDDPAHCGSCSKTCVIGSPGFSCFEGECSGSTTITALDDTRLQDNAPDDVLGTLPTLLIDDGPNRYEVLIKAPELDLLPRGANIESATLRLTCSDAGGPVDVRVVTADWDVDLVTWNSRPALDPAVVANFSANNGPITVPLTSVVQGWVDGDNFGVNMATESAAGSDYHATEAADAALRPALELTATY